MSTPNLVTKLYIPPPPPKVILRPRLIKRLNKGLASGGIPELIKPESELNRGESGIEDILRWADDGGKMLDLVENRTVRSNPDAAGHDLLYYETGAMHVVYN